MSPNSTDAHANVNGLESCADNHLMIVEHDMTITMYCHMRVIDIRNVE